MVKQKYSSAKTKKGKDMTIQEKLIREIEKS